MVISDLEARPDRLTVEDGQAKCKLSGLLQTCCGRYKVEDVVGRCGDSDGVEARILAVGGQGGLRAFLSARCTR